MTTNQEDAIGGGKAADSAVRRRRCNPKLDRQYQAL